MDLDDVKLDQTEFTISCITHQYFTSFTRQPIWHLPSMLKRYCTTSMNWQKAKKKNLRVCYIGTNFSLPLRLLSIKSIFVHAVTGHMVDTIFNKLLSLKHQHIHALSDYTWLLDSSWGPNGEQKGGLLEFEGASWPVLCSRQCNPKT